MRFSPPSAVLMRPAACVCFLIFVVATVAQSSAPSKDPKELLTEAQPFYNYDQAGLRPWHLKATYQIFDPLARTSQNGTFDFWWVAPGVDRSTWTRDGKTVSEWNTADNRHESFSDGLTLGYDEHRLRSVLLSPLPDKDELDSNNVQLELRSLGNADTALRCVMVGPKMKETTYAPIGLFPTYCFDTKLPVLLGRYSYQAPVVEFSHIAKTQNRYLARQVDFVDGKQKLVTVTVDDLNAISPSDPALIPPPNADVIVRASGKRPLVPSPGEPPQGQPPLPPGIAMGKLLSKVMPVYPQEAKRDREQGTVVLDAVIGVDGWVHGLRVASAPSAWLAASALAAVARWHYRPYLLNGNPVEVDTTIRVIYAMSW